MATITRIVYDAWCPYCGAMYGTYAGPHCPRCDHDTVVLTHDYRENAEAIRKGKAKVGQGRSHA